MKVTGGISHAAALKIAPTAGQALRHRQLLSIMTSTIDALSRSRAARSTLK